MNLKVLTKVALATSVMVGLLHASPHKLDMSHTEVGFIAKHLTITNVRGKFNTFSGKIDFDQKTKQFNSLSAVIQTGSVDTSNQKRDDDLKSANFFSAEKYPQITFLMKSYSGDDTSGVMVGDLSIRGITKEVKLETEVATIKGPKGHNRVGFTLQGNISRSEFDLKWNKALEAGGFIVGDKIKLAIDAQAIEL